MILNSYFDIGYFEGNFVNFFDLDIFCDSYFDKVTVVYSYYSYLGVVFSNEFYCECFCLVNSGLFSCSDKKIYLILYVSLICSDYLIVIFYNQVIRFCDFKIYFSYNLIEISACCSLSTSFRKSLSGLDLKMDAMLSFLSLFFLLVV